jgi:hypothetical protein
MVRQKHAAEQTLKEYLLFLSTMSNEEIEIAMGRLADILSDSSDVEVVSFMSLKGRVLKIYLDLRLSGLKKQKGRGRSNHKLGMNIFYAAKGKAIHAQWMQRYQEAMCIYDRNFDEWRNEVKRIPLLRRFFSAPPHPKKPELPDIVDAFIKYSQKDANLSDYLIASAVDFGQNTFLAFCADINQSKISMLAP